MDPKTGLPSFRKVPYKPGAGDRVRAKANDHTTWDKRCVAEASVPELRKKYGALVGVGFELGIITKNYAIGGIDLDGCRNPVTGVIDPWAAAIMARWPTYCEISPSGTGVKLFFMYHPVWLPEFRKYMGTAQWSKVRRKKDGGDHGPAIEICLGGRYFTTTFNPVVGHPPYLAIVTQEMILHVIRVDGPALAGLPTKKPASKVASAKVVRADFKSRTGRTLTARDAYVEALRVAMGPVAREMIADYREDLSSETKKLRFGRSGASIEVDLVKGLWVDHSVAKGKPGRGGDVVALVMFKLKLSEAGALAWLKKRGHLQMRSAA